LDKSSGMGNDIAVYHAKRAVCQLIDSQPAQRPT
jgi:hypothetical protein